MKERFAKLLLGEDMSGAGNGVSSALALSNAITNLAGIFHKIYVFFQLTVLFKWFFSFPEEEALFKSCVMCHMVFDF